MIAAMPSVVTPVSAETVTVPAFVFCPIVATLMLPLVAESVTDLPPLISVPALAVIPAESVRETTPAVADEASTLPSSVIVPAAFVCLPVIVVTAFKLPRAVRPKPDERVTVFRAIDVPIDPTVMLPLAAVSVTDLPELMSSVLDEAVMLPAVAITDTVLVAAVVAFKLPFS